MSEYNHKNSLHCLMWAIFKLVSLISCTHSEQFVVRTFLMREILILLNRLVSSPSYSAIVLHFLTSTRDMASLTIDVATRLSRKGTENERQDSMVKQIRRTEIIDLARLFKKRVLTYIGDRLLWSLLPIPLFNFLYIYACMHACIILLL